MMKYVYFKSCKGNFGDDLNGWLWPQIFHRIPASNDCHFFGIGSILHNENASLAELGDSQKIVFGTGVRPSKLYKPFKVDASWEIKFLRGPLSVQALGNKHEFITDAAYAVRQLDTFEQLRKTPKKYKVSLMPYFHSVEYFNWEKICGELGFHYISPYSEKGVLFTLQEIAASEKIVTEAMHGAIAADLLRVPWQRFIFSTPHTEGAMVSEFKWSDWLQSVKLGGIESTYIPFYQKTKVNKWVKGISNNIVSVEILLKSKVRKNLIEQLEKESPSYLSETKVMEEIDQRIFDKIEELKLEKASATIW